VVVVISLDLLLSLQYQRHMKDISWLLLTYKVPPDPAAKRIALWRKLKGLGAVYLQNGVCLLPKTDRHIRQIKTLENDILENNGSCVILETVALDQTQEDRVVGRFQSDRDDAYEEIIDKCDDFEAEVAKEIKVNHLTFAELEENEVDLKKLQGWLGRIQALDFYQASQAEEAARRVAACETVLDDYAKRVFNAHDENN
jgi:CRISPR/Cas system-associated endoribonuclease Cas2